MQDYRKPGRRTTTKLQRRCSGLMLGMKPDVRKMGIPAGGLTRYIFNSMKWLPALTTGRGTRHSQLHSRRVTDRALQIYRQGTDV